MPPGLFAVMSRIYYVNYHYHTGSALDCFCHHHVTPPPHTALPRRCLSPPAPPPAPHHYRISAVPPPAFPYLFHVTPTSDTTNAAYYAPPGTTFNAYQHDYGYLDAPAYRTLLHARLPYTGVPAPAGARSPPTTPAPPLLPINIQRPPVTHAYIQPTFAIGRCSRSGCCALGSDGNAAAFLAGTLDTACDATAPTYLPATTIARCLLPPRLHRTLLPHLPAHTVANDTLCATFSSGRVALGLFCRLWDHVLLARAN